MAKHLKEVKVRPFILVKLLHELIDRQHSPFADSAQANDFKVRIAAAVAERYPEEEHDVPEDARQGTIPPVILAEIEQDWIERQSKQRTSGSTITVEKRYAVRCSARC
jgi:hypothetical protein